MEQFKSSQNLQETAPIDEFFKVVSIETLALFEFLYKFDVFAPASKGRTRKHHAPELSGVFLHSYYNDIHDIPAATQELQKPLVWLI